ncbi:MAG: glycine cleavage system protein GcvH [Oscillospiraceae bacterium]|jgi:glycine cleavage system H protein|nr:glycine cleavage system protein GcvH [Oscillospiraceae bacterium]
MSIPSNLYYTKSHEWVSIEGGKAKVGITDHAQHEMGDIVFAELPSIGDAIGAGERVASVESVKAVSDVYSPIGGTVVAVNDDVADDPAKLNRDAYGAWLAELEGEFDTAGLLSAEEYSALVASEETK